MNFVAEVRKLGCVDTENINPDDQPNTRKFASRSGLKLEAALDNFALDVSGYTCADFGCNVGGFTDCLLTRGAIKVFAIDTGYGALAWTLRRDERVVVMERTNALHAEPQGPVDLVTIDVAWTPQRLILPAARRWLGQTGRVLTLVKPHYEASAAQQGGRNAKRKKHVLSPQQAEEVLHKTLAEMEEDGWKIEAQILSPLTGSHGNKEYLILVHWRGG